MQYFKKVSASFLFESMYPQTKHVDCIYNLVVLGCIIQYSAEMLHVQNTEKSLSEQFLSVLLPLSISTD